MSNWGTPTMSQLMKWASGSALVALLGACSSAPSASENIVKSQSQALVSTTITLQSPNGVPVLSPVITGVQAVNLSAAAVINGTTVSMGTSGFSSEPDSKTNDIWSRGTATLKDRDKVTGVVHARTIVRGSGVVITGGTDTTPVFDPPTTLSWTVTYPTGTAPSYTLNTGETRTLAPGLYGSLIVNSGGTLNLSSGTYYLTTLDMEASSKIKLDQTNGPVIIYETTNLILRGAFTTSTGADPDLLLGYLGTNPIFVESAFTGAIIAPASSLTLRRVTGTLAGYFYGKTVASLDGATVSYRAPQVIAVASGSTDDPQKCAQLLIPPSNLSGQALAIASQQLINRYCSMPNTPQCISSLAGRASADYTASAKQFVASVMTGARYLGVSRDRTRKYQAALANATLASSICAGPDADGDWVPDSKDLCPNTPDLTPTDDNGCPTALPQAPDDNSVRQVLNAGGIMWNPRCVDAAPPAESAGSALYQTAAPNNGLYIVTRRVTNQPANCPIWYLFEIRELPPSGPPLPSYQVAFKDTEAVSIVAGIPGLPTVPSSLVQFLAKPGDPTTRGQLGKISSAPSWINFRVQAINANGQRGPWSEWKVPNVSDCLSLGITCASR